MSVPVRRISWYNLATDELNKILEVNRDIDGILVRSNRSNGSDYFAAEQVRSVKATLTTEGSVEVMVGLDRIIGTDTQPYSKPKANFNARETISQRESMQYEKLVFTVSASSFEQSMQALSNKCSEPVILSFG